MHRLAHSAIAGYTTRNILNMLSGWWLFAKVHLGWKTIFDHDWSQNRDSPGRPQAPPVLAGEAQEAHRGARKQDRVHRTDTILTAVFSLDTATRTAKVLFFGGR